MKVILFNGPPRSGKDTAVLLLKKRALDIGIRVMLHESFATPLKAGVHAFFDSRPKTDADKDRPIPGYTMTWRQAYIGMSELFAKPLGGNDIFGIMATRRMLLPGAVYVFSDSGFTPEAEAVRDMVGSKNMLIVQIRRQGCTFDHDSRAYVYLGEAVKVIQIDNRHTLELFEEELVMRVGEWLKR